MENEMDRLTVSWKLGVCGMGIKGLGLTRVANERMEQQIQTAFLAFGISVWGA